tara:strand:- start:31547 stop:33055 length:1509 start_codon:yes stop_codon:yes gene_type:complete
VINWLKSQETITEKQVKSGLRSLVIDGMCSQVMGVFTGGAFLVAFALLLGASNKTIGLLAAIGPATQILQIPAIYLVDRLRLRKALVVLTCIVGRFFWLVAAAIPWLLPEGMRVPVLLIAIAVYFGLGAIAGCAWNSWMRDFVPESIMGGFFAKRMAISTALGAILSLGAGFGIDYFKTQFSSELTVYSILLAAGGLSGLFGCFFQMRIPEPVMAPVDDHGLMSLLAEPFRKGNFRQLLVFMGLWSFAVNLAAPFFTVYLLKRIGLSMTWVIGLSVLSQLVNVVFFRIWGKLADRYSNKSVLTVSGPLFIISIAVWPFTTMPDSYFMTIPLLIAIHVLTGISTAGVNLCAGNLALKAAPKGRATSYLAVNSLVCGIAATIAPIIAGFGADWFATKQMTVDLSWISGEVRQTLPAIDIKGLDFLFILSVIMGFYALHRLLSVREEGEAEERVVFRELILETRKVVRHVSNVSGLRTLTYFPYQQLTKILPRRKDEEDVDDIDV